MYLGLANVINATSTLDYLTEDITGWVEGNNTGEMDATACALEYAVNSPSAPTFDCSNLETTTRLDENVTFDNNRSYELVEVNSFFYLVSRDNPLPSTLGSTILTDGLCSTDFNTTTATPDGIVNSYPCPVSQDAADDEFSTAAILVETLNDGLDITAGALSDDPQLQADIEEFKAEVAGDSGDITIDDIINYLND